MLHVDYEVKTKQGTHESIHYPPSEIRDISGNIMIIEGPNSSGKSTLMNLIALGSFGKDDETLSKSMRSNLKELSESSYRSISFDITIKDPKTGKQLQYIWKEGSEEPIVFENGTQIGKQEFRQRYSLIYDIPEDPTARLKNISKTIRDDHINLLNRIDEYGSLVSSIWGSISEAKTAADIDAIKKNIQECTSQLNELDKQNSGLQKVVKLELAKSLREYDEINKELTQLQPKIDFELNKPTMDRSTHQNDAKVEQYWEKIRSTEPSLAVTVKSTNNSNLIAIYDELISCHKKILNSSIGDHVDILKEYSKKVQEALNYIPDLNEEGAHISAVNRAIEAIQQIGIDEQIGNLGSISDIIEALKQYGRKFGDQYTINSYKNIKKELNTIKGELPSIMVKQSTVVKQLSEPVVLTRYRDEATLSSLNQKKEGLIKKKNKLQEDLISKGIDLNNSIKRYQELCRDLSIDYSASSTEIGDQLSIAKENAKGVEQERKKLKTKIDSYQKIVDDFENGEKSPYLEDRDQIKKIMNSIRSIKGKINTANERLNTIDKGDSEAYLQNPDLYKPIWEYIGYRLGTVRDKGREYPVKSVDLLIEPKGVIYTEDGTEIHIGAMGTGEGQLSYIRGLLSDEDGRMKIILLDEIGNMSNANVEYVEENLEKLQSKGQLMVGMMVRPGDEMEVTTYGL